MKPFACARLPCNVVCRYYTDEYFASWLRPIHTDILALVGGRRWTGQGPFPQNRWEARTVFFDSSHRKEHHRTRVWHAKNCPEMGRCPTGSLNTWCLCLPLQLADARDTGTDDLHGGGRGARRWKPAASGSAS